MTTKGKQPTTTKAVRYQGESTRILRIGHEEIRLTPGESYDLPLDIATSLMQSDAKTFLEAA